MEARGVAWRNDAGQYRLWDPYGRPVHPGAYLSVQLAGRRRCRNGLVGLRVSFRGQVLTIRSTRWGVDGKLIVSTNRDLSGGSSVILDELILLDRWPARCCHVSPKLLREAVAARRAGR